MSKFEEREDENSDLAKSFIGLFAKKLSEELIEMRDAGVDAGEEHVQEMIGLLHGLNVIAIEQELGEAMKKRMEAIT